MRWLPNFEQHTGQLNAQVKEDGVYKFEFENSVPLCNCWSFALSVRELKRVPGSKQMLVLTFLEIISQFNR